MDEAILKAAKHVYDHLDDDIDTSAELELLQSNIEDNGELDCDGFDQRTRGNGEPVMYL